MQLISLGSKPEIKCAELTLDDRVKVLFSYGKPVACLIPGEGYFRSKDVVSKTTERHIAGWIDGVFQAERVTPDFFDKLIATKATELAGYDPARPGDAA